MTCYAAPDVVAVQHLYGDHAGVPRAMAAALAAGHRRRLRGAAVVLANWQPACAGRSAQDIWGTELTRADIGQTVAREHGCADWATLVAARADPTFEAAVTALLAGDIDVLTQLLDAAPDLVHRRSHWGHHATLPHYLAANGVETYRQIVPVNAAAIAALLLARGADFTATAHAYDTDLSVMELVSTSAHPRAAGVSDALIAVLRQGVGGEGHRSAQ